MKQIYIINGPNLNLLGRRENDIYGDIPFEIFFAGIKEEYRDKCRLHYFQSNHEGHIIDKLQEIGYGIDGIVINPAAYTHTSVAIGDCIKAISSPCVEVHISNIYDRESFRHLSYVKEHCTHSIVGEGLDGYKKAIDLLL